MGYKIAAIYHSGWFHLPVSCKCNAGFRSFTKTALPNVWSWRKCIQHLSRPTQTYSDNKPLQISLTSSCSWGVREYLLHTSSWNRTPSPFFQSVYSVIFSLWFDPSNQGLIGLRTHYECSRESFNRVGLQWAWKLDICIDTLPVLWFNPSLQTYSFHKWPQYSWVLHGSPVDRAAALSLSHTASTVLKSWFL